MAIYGSDSDCNTKAVSLNRFWAVSLRQIRKAVFMDKRKQAEENYRKRFEELGLSERFEFIRREWSKTRDRRFWSRCKTCGEVFLTWNDVLRGKQKHLLCQKCGAASDGNDIFARSNTAKRAAELYAEGLEQKEIASILGCSTWDVGTAAKKYKVVDPDRKYNGSRKANAKRSERAEKEIEKHLDEMGFKYIGGYTNKTGSVMIKCKTCGFEFSRTVKPIKDRTVHCIECQKRETRERNEAERKKHADQAEIKKLEREWYRRLYPPKNSYDDQHEAFLNRIGICEICGTPYTVRDYVESCGLKQARNNGVCSDKCRRIKTNRSVRNSHKRRGVRDTHRHRAKKYNCEYDPGVTLKKLIDRDGLRCAICGELCDWNDHSWSEYCGPKYPSIDHIVPMSKGGGHTWGNVQVAHVICNSEKGDKVVSE